MSKREIQGVVVRRSGDKTVAVQVVRTQRHRLYGKQIINTKIYLAHDADNSVEVGQQVMLRESRPLSKRKRWTVVSDQVDKLGKQSK